jgi:hypothetical protein
VRTGSAALRTLLAAAVPVGLVLSAAVVWQSTAAAFTATTDNAGNTWQAGTVVLADSQGGSKLFDTTTGDGALHPGSTRSRCIRVDYTGTLAADIRLYVTSPDALAVTLDPYLVMSVERGQDVAATTPVAPDCSTGFTVPATLLYNAAPASDPGATRTSTMADLKASHGDYTHGLHVGTGPVAGGTSLTFRITYRVADDNHAQGTSSKATFTWEAQNT